MDREGPTGIEHPPVAPVLMESLRAVGYTTSSALADLIDNSIAAASRNISIRFATVPTPTVSVVDDGHGMSESELVAAMRFGSRDPRQMRAGADLGRFGLGQKTASISQCRRLVVASLQNEQLSVAVWDLDDCETRGTWWLGRPDKSIISDEVLQLLYSHGHGTAVIWENLDRLAATGGSDPRRAMEIALENSADHLAMAFHRFLSGEISNGLSITINDRGVPRVDPFLQHHVRGQQLHSEIFTIEGCKVTVSPFVLPFPSKLKPEELERAGGRESLKTGHGFYVYRGGRLVVPGGWFRIVPSDELIRLARVRVDVPVELDHLWKVDIRKTVVEPPAALRPHLKRIVGDVTLRSRRVYSHKGNPRADADRIPLWRRHELRDGAATWRVNRDHPAISAYTAAIPELGKVFDLLEGSLPVHDIHLHISNDLPVADDIQMPDSELESLARRMIDAFGDQPDHLELILKRLPLMDPFNRNAELTLKLIERFRND
jgi:hypothetical protein